MSRYHTTICAKRDSSRRHLPLMCCGRRVETVRRSRSRSVTFASIATSGLAGKRGQNRTAVRAAHHHRFACGLFCPVEFGDTDIINRWCSSWSVVPRRASMDASERFWTRWGSRWTTFGSLQQILRGDSGLAKKVDINRKL